MRLGDSSTSVGACPRLPSTHDSQDVILDILMCIASSSLACLLRKEKALICRDDVQLSTIHGEDIIRHPHMYEGATDNTVMWPTPHRTATTMMQDDGGAWRCMRSGP